MVQPSDGLHNGSFYKRMWNLAPLPMWPILGEFPHNTERSWHCNLHHCNLWTLKGYISTIYLQNLALVISSMLHIQTIHSSAHKRVNRRVISWSHNECALKIVQHKICQCYVYSQDLVTSLHKWSCSRCLQQPVDVISYWGAQIKMHTMALLYIAAQRSLPLARLFC